MNNHYYPAMKTVLDILSVLDDLRVYNGMQYDFSLKQLIGRVHLFVDLWETQDLKNTYFSHCSSGRLEGMISPVISSADTSGLGWIAIDDNDQDKLHELLALLTAMRGSDDVDI